MQGHNVGAHVSKRFLVRRPMYLECYTNPRLQHLARMDGRIHDSSPCSIVRCRGIEYVLITAFQRLLHCGTSYMMGEYIFFCRPTDSSSPIVVQVGSAPFLVLQPSFRFPSDQPFSVNNDQFIFRIPHGENPQSKCNRRVIGYSQN